MSPKELELTMKIQEGEKIIEKNQIIYEEMKDLEGKIKNQRNALDRLKYLLKEERKGKDYEVQFAKEYLQIPIEDDRVLVSNHPAINNYGDYYLTKEQNDKFLNNGQVLVGIDQKVVTDC